MRRIIVIGDAIRDVYREYRRCRTENVHGVPVAEWHGEESIPGGACAVARMCEHLGAEDVALHTGAVSEKVRYVLDGQCLMRVDEDRITPPKDAVRALGLLWADDLLIVSDYGKGMICREVIAMLEQHRGVVLADPHISRSPTYYPTDWICCPNRETYEAHQPAWVIRSEYAPVCVKLAELGCMVVHDGKTTKIRPIRVGPGDPCAAGDQWIAALAVSLLEGCDLLVAARKANVAAGLKLGKRGATPVERNEWMRFLQGRQEQARWNGLTV